MDENETQTEATPPTPSRKRAGETYPAVGKFPATNLSGREQEQTNALAEFMRGLGFDYSTNPAAKQRALRFLRSLAILVISSVLAVCVLNESVTSVMGFLVLGAVLDLVSWLATAPGTGAAMTLLSGDGQYIANGADKKQGQFLVPARILGLAAWTKAQAVGYTQWVWPSLGEQVRGNRIRNTANDPSPGMGLGAGWRFRPTDPVSVTQVGSATAGDIETAHLLLWYEDLPGTQGRMISVSELRKRGVQQTTVEGTIASGTSGEYTGEEALNAESDLLQTGADYAVLGACFGIVHGAFAIRGRDNAGLRYGMPGSLDRKLTSAFFLDLAIKYDLPIIPVISANNRANTFLSTVQDENGTDVPYSLNLVQLDRRFETDVEPPAASEGPQVPANA